MIPPGKKRHVGRPALGAEKYEALVADRFPLARARDPETFLARTKQWASPEAYASWLTAYQGRRGNFLDHAVWGADRDLGIGKWLWGAMDDRWATNAARVFGRGGLNDKIVAGKRACVVGAWDGTECLLLSALGAQSVDAIDEVPAFCEMARLQYETWGVAGEVHARSLYEVDIRESWQKYDLLYVPGVLYHLTDLPTAVVILWSMLTPGGILAFESVADPTGSLRARYVGAGARGWNWWAPTPECYVALLRDCGFKDGRTVEFNAGRGWWAGTRDKDAAALSNGAAGFSRPDILRTIAALRGDR